MVPDKLNICFNKEGVAYRWLGQDMPLVWDTEPVTQTADEIMADTLQQWKDRSSPRGKAKAFLLKILAGGPKPIDAVKKTGEEENIAEATLLAAKRDLKIEMIRRKEYGGKCCWALSGTTKAEQDKGIVS